MEIEVWEPVFHTHKGINYTITYSTVFFFLIW